MELEFFYPFTLGVLAGGGLFGFGLLVGLIANRDTFTRQVKDEEFDPEAERVDDEFFHESWEGATEMGEFPTDSELERLHRHSTY
jgi:hypothetical protein